MLEINHVVTLDIYLVVILDLFQFRYKLRNFIIYKSV